MLLCQILSSTDRRVSMRFRERSPAPPFGGRRGRRGCTKVPFCKLSGWTPCSQVLAGAGHAIESPGRSVRSRAREVAAASAAAALDGSTRCSTDTPTQTRSCLWRGVRSSALGHRRDGAAPPPHIAQGVVLGGVPGHDAHAGDVRSESTSARHPHTATQKGGAESDWARTPLSRDGFPTPKPPASEQLQSLATANRLFTATTKTAPPRKSTRFAMIRVIPSPM